MNYTFLVPGRFMKKENWLLCQNYKLLFDNEPDSTMLTIHHKNTKSQGQCSDPHW